jgi:hypothetical protein
MVHAGDELMINLHVLRKSLYYSGLALLAVATGLFANHITGLVPLNGLLGTESALHMIGRLAVGGCVLAALGSLD